MRWPCLSPEESRALGDIIITASVEGSEEEIQGPGSTEEGTTVGGGGVHSYLGAAPGKGKPVSPGVVVRFRGPMPRCSVLPNPQHSVSSSVKGG